MTSPSNSAAHATSESAPKPWQSGLRDVLRALEITLVAHVPDAAHAPLIRQCEAAADMTVITLTTEEEGVGLLCGAWAGGQRGVLLMQSSGVGNTINALALPNICRVPFLTLVSMRGEWGEFVPWQIPMGQATPAVLSAMGLQVFRAERPEDITATALAAGQMAFNTRSACAALISQQAIGAKQFTQAPAEDIHASLGPFAPTDDSAPQTEDPAHAAKGSR